MVETLKWFLRRESEVDQERFELIEELNRTQTAIQRTYAQFNSTGDPDLIEAAVFEIKAHQSRYSYYLRRLKELDGTAEPQMQAE